MRAIRAARAVTCIALASALCVPAFAAQFDYFLKIEGVDGESTAADKGHKNEIEILSWSWGASQPATSGGGMGAGKANVQDISMTKATGTPKAEKQRKRPGRVKYGDITLKRGVAAEPTAASSGGVSVAAGDVDGDGRAETAKHKSGSMTYLNRTRQKELGKPAPAGSVTLMVPPGHGLCTAGKSLGTLTLAGSGMQPYVLKGVTVAGCAAASGESRPMESLSLNYTKIEY